MKKVAVIILNWNGAALLRRYLPGVLENTDDTLADVIVADNGSDDESRDVLDREFPQVKTLCFESNLGFAGGYNRAIKETGYELTILLNSDVRTPAGWLAPLIEALDDEAVGAVQPKLLKDRDDDRRVFEYAGAMGGFLDKHGYPYCRGRVFASVEDDRGQFDADGVTPVFWASGACLAVRTAAFTAVGGLDASFFAHMEEIDLCWRLRARGRDIFCIPQSVVYHVGGGTLNAGSPHKTFLNFRNNLFMLYKNLPDCDLRPVMRMRCLLDYVAAAKMLLTDGPSHAAAVLRARREYKARRHEFRPQREENLRLSTGKPIAEILPASLLWLYYARGRKTFARLRGVEG